MECVNFLFSPRFSTAFCTLILVGEKYNLSIYSQISSSMLSDFANCL